MWFHFRAKGSWKSHIPMCLYLSLLQPSITLYWKEKIISDDCCFIRWAYVSTHRHVCPQVKLQAQECARPIKQSKLCHAAESTAPAGVSYQVQRRPNNRLLWAGEHPSVIQYVYLIMNRANASLDGHSGHIKHSIWAQLMRRSIWYIPP